MSFFLTQKTLYDGLLQIGTYNESHFSTNSSFRWFNNLDSDWWSVGLSGITLDRKDSTIEKPNIVPFETQAKKVRFATGSSITYIPHEDFNRLI